MRDYDAVVVGSGFGGGVAACRLAAAGWSVCVLERGRRFGGDDFPAGPDDLPGAIWHPSANPRGLYEIRLMRDVATITASGVGGGSLVYANVQLRAPAAVFSAGWPAAIDRAELDPWYDRTEEALTPRKTPDDPALDKVRAFGAMAVRARRSAELLPVAVHFGDDRDNPFSGVHQQGCDNLGRCITGCPIGAKNTVDITYVARAERDGAEVFPLHEVERIERDGGGWRVGYRRRDGAGGDGAVRGKVLVLAAGALGTTRLLLRNRKRLPQLSPALGTRFSGNGDALGMAFDPQAADVRGAREHYGPTMTSKIDLGDERRMIVANGGLPESLGFVLDIVRGYNALTGWARMRVRLKAAAARLGLSDRTLSPREARLSGRAPSEDTLVFLMMGRDAADGKMRLTWPFNCFDVRWRKDASRALFDEMQRTTDELAAAAQAKPYFALDAGPVGKFLTVHPLGGCPMGDDPATSVLDERGRAHGYDTLLVADGAAVPTALGVNPSKTIAALAERSVQKLIDGGRP